MKRQEKNEARRTAILDAALTEFSSMGFAAARMEDIARRAGVAKGTLYLYFTDKAGLFAGLIDAHLAPIYQRARAVMADPSRTLAQKLLLLTEPLRADNGRSPAAGVILLLHCEGQHTPQIIQTYLTNLLGPVLELHREHLTSSAQHTHPALKDFPQLLLGPLVHGIIWQTLFGQVLPLDLNAMYTAYLNMILPD